MDINSILTAPDFSLTWVALLAAAFVVLAALMGKRNLTMLDNRDKYSTDQIDSTRHAFFMLAVIAVGMVVAAVIDSWYTEGQRAQDLQEAAIQHIEQDYLVTDVRPTISAAPAEQTGLLHEVMDESCRSCDTEMTKLWSATLLDQAHATNSYVQVTTVDGTTATYRATWDAEDQHIELRHTDQTSNAPSPDSLLR